MPKVIHLLTPLETILQDLQEKLEAGEINNPILLFTSTDEDGDECVGYWPLVEDLDSPMVVFMCEATKVRMLE